MKKYAGIVLFFLIFSGFHSPCPANPLTDFISLFQKDLVITVLYKNPDTLVQGSEVYLAEDPQKHKILIGKVTALSLTESQMSKVEITIDKKHKEKIYETTPFVLMSSYFSDNSTTTIVAVSSLEEPDRTPLKSGSSVNGVTFLEYKMAIAGEALKKLIDHIKKQNIDLLGQLEQYADTFNTEAFRKRIDDLIQQLSEFSSEQKQAFKKEVLPSLQKTFDAMKEKLEQQNNSEQSNDLEKQLKEIKDLVDV